MRAAQETSKYTVPWLLRGTSHHLMFLNAVYLSRGAERIVCGFPRSGTSWLSEMVAQYYDMDCPRRYSFPTFKRDVVIHTHLLPRFPKQTLFYVERDCQDVYISLFIKRLGIRDKQEIVEPTNATLLWSIVS